jgi:DNA-binding response OmpR family regulator
MKNDKNILIIDNSQTTLIILEWFLKSQGYHTMIATNVKEAMIQADVKNPDLILLELRLPGISGFDFLKMVKFNSDCINIPILVISALNSKETIKKAHLLGADGFISKPIILKDLLIKIESILKLSYSSFENISI